MSKFGGGTKFGGGAKFGGGPSYYQAWREKLIEWLGNGPIDASDEDSVAFRWISSWGGQGAGAQCDGDRIVSEGTPGLAVESLSDWEAICEVARLVLSDDARRLGLRILAEGVGEYTSGARMAAMAERIIEAIGDGRSTGCTYWDATIASCATSNDNGQGVRYWCLKVPAWVWYATGEVGSEAASDSTYRPYYDLIRTLCRRMDGATQEAEVTIEDKASGEPAFFFGRSITDRDVVRN